MHNEDTTPADSSASQEPPARIEGAQLRDAVRWFMQGQGDAEDIEAVIREVRSAIARGPAGAIVLKPERQPSKRYRLSAVREPGLLEDIDTITFTALVRVRHLLSIRNDPARRKGVRAEAVKLGMPPYLKVHEIEERFSQRPELRLPEHLRDDGPQRRPTDVAAALGITFDVVPEEKVDRFLRRLDNDEPRPFVIVRSWLGKEVRSIWQRLAARRAQAQTRSIDVNLRGNLHHEHSGQLSVQSTPAGAGSPAQAATHPPAEEPEDIAGSVPPHDPVLPDAITMLEEVLFKQDELISEDEFVAAVIRRKLYPSARQATKNGWRQLRPKIKPPSNRYSPDTAKKLTLGNARLKAWAEGVELKRNEPT